MTIAYFDYRREYRELQGDIDGAVRRVLASGSLILGPEVREFERECAAYLGTGGAVGVNSGTDALILALRAVGVGEGDEVITVANAGVPPVAAIRAAGAVPRFVDVDPATLLMDVRRLEDAITERTRCVLPVHLYGQPVDLDEVQRFAARHGLRVVEDCAQACGATYRDRRVGGFGDVGCFSFYPTKTLGAFGDGGLCATSDGAIEERLRMLRMYGFRDDRHAHCEGMNSRLDELQAAILRVKLAHLDESLASRREIAGIYREGLDGDRCRIPAITPRGTHVYHLFVILVDDRDRVIESLREAGIGFGIHYPEPIHLMEAYRFLGYRKGDLPATESGCVGVLSLPIYPGLRRDEVQQVILAVRAAS